MASIFATIALVLACISYVPYIKDIFTGQTKPHAFSWLVYAILGLIGFAAQYDHDAGPGAWVTGFTGLLCGFIFILALIKGDRRFTRFDWICVSCSLLAILPWLLVDNPLASVLLIIFIDGAAFSLTFKKAFTLPYEETVSTYIIGSCKHFLSVLAITNLIFINIAYPAFLGVANIVFVLMVVIRRRQLPQKGIQHDSVPCSIRP